MSGRAYYKSARRSKMDDGRHDGQFADLIPKKKIGPFIILFNRIKDKLGTYEKAMIRIELGHDTADDLRKGERLTSGTAKKILSTYKEVCNG